MRASLLIVAPLIALACASPAPQGVTSAISPKGTAPADCSSSYDGKFQISAVNASESASKKSKTKRQDGNLEISLSGGILTDQNNRTGYIASNYQFQFDKPPQAGAIYTAGFSACSNGTLALGSSAIWYACLSGNFYNIYDRYWADQCSPVYLSVSGGGSSSASSSGQASATSVSGSSSSAAGEKSEGQPTASSVANSTATSGGTAKSTAASTTAGTSATATGSGASSATRTSSQTQAPQFSGAAASRPFGEKLVAAAAGVAGAVALL